MIILFADPQAAGKQPVWNIDCALKNIVTRTLKLEGRKFMLHIRIKPYPGTNGTFLLRNGDLSSVPAFLFPTAMMYK